MSPFEFFSKQFGWQRWLLRLLVTWLAFGAFWLNASLHLLSRMKFALHVISIVLEKIVYESLNGFGVGKLTWQGEGILLLCSLYGQIFISLLLIVLLLSSWNVSDYEHLKRELEPELVEGVDGQLAKSFLDLPKAEQQSKLKDRLKKYCQKVLLLHVVPLK